MWYLLFYGEDGASYANNEAMFLFLNQGTERNKKVPSVKMAIKISD